MLTNKWLNNTKYFEAPNDGGKVPEKSAAELEREKINITGTTTGDKVDDQDDTDKDDEVNDADKETKDDDKEDAEDKGRDKEDKDVDEDKEPSEEDTKKELEKLKKQVERLNKRVGKTAGERDAIKKELRDARASLEAKVKEGEQPLTEEEVERRANEKANQRVTEDAFNKAQERLAKAAIKADKDFMSKINELAEEVAPIPGSMIGILEDLDNDNGGAVLAYLANNPDDFEEIHTLPLPKMARRLDKISNKLAEEAKVKPKAISKVPKPNEPIGGNTGNSSNSLIITGKESMEEFIRKRSAQVEARRKAKLG